MAIPFTHPNAGKERVDVAAGEATERPYAYASRDPRALRILAKTIYREMRTAGLTEEDLMSVASEMLSLVAGDMKARRNVVETPVSASQSASRATPR
jgi:hypothetical protein